MCVERQCDAWKAHKALKPHYGEVVYCYFNNLPCLTYVPFQNQNRKRLLYRGDNLNACRWMPNTLLSAPAAGAALQQRRRPEGRPTRLSKGARSRIYLASAPRLRRSAWTEAWRKLKRLPPQTPVEAYVCAHVAHLQQGVHVLAGTSARTCILRRHTPLDF